MVMGAEEPSLNGISHSERHDPCILVGQSRLKCREEASDGGGAERQCPVDE
jgi:hypothetical protein